MRLLPNMVRGTPPAKVHRRNALFFEQRIALCRMDTIPTSTCRDLRAAEEEHQVVVVNAVTGQAWQTHKGVAGAVDLGRASRRLTSAVWS
jgi:hypothetical protein